MEIKFTIKQVVAVGIGAALFVVIGMINIPTPVPNTSIQLQYAVQALLSIIFGPIIGLLVGLIGHAIKDSLVGYGLWWTWIIASGLFGLVVGLFRKYVRVINGVFDWKDILIFNLIQLLANALVWGVLAPLGDVVIYQEAAEKVFAQGIVAGIANGVSVAVTLMVGTLIVILSQRIKDQVWRKIVQIVLGLYLVSVLVSRVYLGVHYPSDVLASLCVGLGVLFIEFPFYDKLRFQWRFKGKQK